MSIYGCIAELQPLSLPRWQTRIRAPSSRESAISRLYPLWLTRRSEPLQVHRLSSTAVCLAPSRAPSVCADTSRSWLSASAVIKAYEERGLDKSNLVLMTCWCWQAMPAHLKGIDDNGQPFEISPDPLLLRLQAIVNPLEVKRRAGLQLPEGSVQPCRRVRVWTVRCRSWRKIEGMVKAVRW